MSDHSPGSTASAASAAFAGRGSRSGPLAAAALRGPANPASPASYQLQRRSEASEHRALVERAADQTRALAAAKAKAKAKAEARAKAVKAAKIKARAEAAAEQRRVQVRQKASRSAQRDPQALARIMAADRGWGSGQFSCLKSLWNRESGWNYRAMNPSSGAYGIPQALPGSKMASAGSDWRTNPATQIKWGLDYIADRYGTPCGAWAHSESSGWY